jgi:protein-arginine kinase activator protein McsA
LDAGIRGIERFLEEYNQVEQASKVGELVFLRRWKEEIAAKIKARDGTGAEPTATIEPEPVDRAAELRAKIELAVAEERYEEAAMFRDELRRLESHLPDQDEGGFSK